MRSFALAGGGVGAGVGTGFAAGGGEGKTRLSSAAGGRNTLSCRSSSAGSISSIFLGTCGWLIKIISMTTWTMAETRNPWR